MNRPDGVWPIQPWRDFGGGVYFERRSSKLQAARPIACDCHRLKNSRERMPEISRFFGIVVRMFVETGGVHHRPHLHAYYGEDTAIYSVDRIERIGGFLPRRRERLVLAWAEIHKDELLQAWRALQDGEPPSRIEPLR